MRQVFDLLESFFVQVLTHVSCGLENVHFVREFQVNAERIMSLFSGCHRRRGKLRRPEIQMAVELSAGPCFDVFDCNVLDRGDPVGHLLPAGGGRSKVL